MSKHTPGEWRVDECGFIMAPQPETAGPGEELPPEYEVASVGDGSPVLTEREKADARLIAAAPDLLAALEGMIEAAALGATEVRLQALQAARAALQAARG